MKAIPHRCPTCCAGTVETEEGVAQNFYGRLVFPKDVPPHVCPNCSTILVPVDNSHLIAARTGAGTLVPNA